MPAFPEIAFSDLDLSPSGLLLFKASAKLPGFDYYDTLFAADLRAKTLEQLSVFPESIMLVENGEKIQIQNRFGVFRTAEPYDGFTAIDLFPAFVLGGQIQSGKISPILASPDGRFLVFTRQTSAAFGKLVLVDLSTSAQFVVSEDVELSLESPSTVWSADSRSFIYAKKGSLYYFSLDQYQEQRILAETYRRIGSGAMANVRWGQGSSLFYVSGNLVYRLDGRELFTRALYSGFLKIGEIRGKIPFDFDPSFDSFWISPDGNKILLDKGGRNLFLYYLRTEDYHSTGGPKTLPYLYLPRNTTVRRVVWSDGDVLSLLAVGIEQGQQKSTIFQLALNHDLSNYLQMDDNALDIVLSPNEKRLAILTDTGIVIRDYETWETLQDIPYRRPLSVLWLSDTRLVVAGAYTTEILDTATGESTFVSLSQVEQFGYAVDSDGVVARIQDTEFRSSLDFKRWEETEDVETQERSVASSDFRVYLEPSSRGNYRNMIMVRDARGYGTEPLFPSERVEYEQFPDREQPLDLSNFAHGSRIRRREVSLVFNVVDSIEGLTFILNTLSEYRLKATFFVNGEAIRRYPGAVKEIAESGHEVGSLFYVYFNMTDSRFHVDRAFIKSGLAKNEDDYYAATGRELSLLWHAPYYFVNSEIIHASREMNYTYVGRDVDALDWVGESESSVASGIYVSSAQLVERITKLKQPGSIIPILVGTGEGERNDYLFHKLDLTINGLLVRGYSIVPVSTLIEHAR